MCFTGTISVERKLKEGIKKIKTYETIIMATVLVHIAERRRQDVAAAKAKVPESVLREQVQEMTALCPVIDIVSRIHAHPDIITSTKDLPERTESDLESPFDDNIELQENEGICRVSHNVVDLRNIAAVAAEFKRASPSKGDIAVDVDIHAQAIEYAAGGASVISVLTEPTDFKGTLNDMLVARQAVETVSHRPAILRKDFIIDSYQLLEARAHGADSVLLIVAILNLETLTQLIKDSRALGMEPLVEVNNEDELDVALAADAKLIGVNNRNLHNFELDLNTTVRMAEAIKQRGIPLGKTTSSSEDSGSISLLALSGVTCREDVDKFLACGATGVLVGELLMRASHPKAIIRSLRGIAEERDGRKSITSSEEEHVIKTCGISTVEAARTAIQTGANFIGLIFAEKSSRKVSIEQAREVVAAVRAFGERTEVVDLRADLETFTAEERGNSAMWFERCAALLRRKTLRTPLVVGVFQNQPAQEVNEIAKATGIDMVQLHGDEGFGTIAEVDLPVIRTIGMPPRDTTTVNLDAIVEAIKPGLAVALLLDTAIGSQSGGTGMHFDWKHGLHMHEVYHIPVIIAGGLTPDNVARAIHIARPFGVDASSGMETDIKGEKDLDKVKAFVHNAKAASQHVPILLEIDENDEAEGDEDEEDS